MPYTRAEIERMRQQGIYQAPKAPTYDYYAMGQNPGYWRQNPWNYGYTMPQGSSNYSYYSQPQVGSGWMGMPQFQSYGSPAPGGATIAGGAASGYGSVGSGTVASGQTNNLSGSVLSPAQIAQLTGAGQAATTTSGGYYSNVPINFMPVGTGITAGGKGVPGSGSSPLSGNDWRPSGLDIVRQNYEAYLKNNELDKEALTLEQYMEARFNAFKAMGGSSNINYTNVDEYYRNFSRELERIMNPRTREEGGIQQSPAYGAGLVTSRF